MDSIFCQSNELGRVFEGQLSIDGVAHDLDAEDYFFSSYFFHTHRKPGADLSRVL